MLNPTTLHLERGQYTQSTYNLWLDEVCLPALVGWFEEAGCTVIFGGKPSSIVNEGTSEEGTLNSKIEAYAPGATDRLTASDGGLSRTYLIVLASTNGLVRNEHIVCHVGRIDPFYSKFAIMVKVRNPDRSGWSEYARDSFGAGTADDDWFDEWSAATLTVTADLPQTILGAQLLQHDDIGQTYTVSVDPVNVTRNVEVNGVDYPIPLGSRRVTFWRYHNVDLDITVSADGFNSVELHNPQTHTHITLERSEDLAPDFITLIVEADRQFTLYQGETHLGTYGVGVTVLSLSTGFTGMLEYSGGHTPLENLVEDTTVTIGEGTGGGDGEPDMTPLPDPVDAENMLIRVYTALPGVVSYDNDGWPSEDIPDTATEGVVDIEVAPPNNWPWSLMTGGVLTFRVGNRSYTKRVEFCPNTSLAVHIGPDVVRVIGGSAPQEVFWKPDGLLSWLKPGLGTSRGTAEGEVGVEFQIETSGLLSITRGGKTYQELIPYHGGTVHEIPYDEVTVKATEGTWGNYGALLPVVVVAILVIIAIAVILGR